MSVAFMLTLIGISIVFLICGICTYITISIYIESIEENKALKDLLKRSKENEIFGCELIEKQGKYLEKYKSN